MAKDTFTVGTPAPVVEPEVVEEAPVTLVEPKPVVSPAKSEVLATLDMSFAEVLKCDSEGKMVRFACEPDRFLRLNDDQVDRLSGFTRGLYLDAARTNARLLTKAAEPNLLADIVQGGGSATSRLEVIGKKPGMHYFWATGDRVQRAITQEGYKVVDDENLQTFRRGPSSTRTVADRGEVEHVLLEIPQEVADKRLKAAGALSTERHLGAQKAGLASLGKGGYDPDKDPADAKRAWETRKPGE